MFVESVVSGYRIGGGASADVEMANAFLRHLEVRSFARLTVRAYAFHVLSFLRFCEVTGLSLSMITPMDVFEFLDWLATPATGKVVRLRGALGASPATMNQRVAAVRGLFEFAVISGLCDRSPVPSARRSVGLRAKKRGLLGHISTGRERTGGRLVKNLCGCPNRLTQTMLLSSCRT
jgi:integrase/recombinase XerC